MTPNIHKIKIFLQNKITHNNTIVCSITPCTQKLLNVNKWSDLILLYFCSGFWDEEESLWCINWLVSSFCYYRHNTSAVVHSDLLSTYLRGLEYDLYLVKMWLCPGYGTKLHLVVKLQFLSSGECGVTTSLVRFPGNKIHCSVQDLNSVTVHVCVIYCIASLLLFLC